MDNKQGHHNFKVDMPVIWSCSVRIYSICMIHKVFSHLGFWSGTFVLIMQFPDQCLPVRLPPLLRMCLVLGKLAHAIQRYFFCCKN